MLKPAFPHGYSVPDFGVDHDILRTKGSIKGAEKSLNKKMNASFEQKTNPVNPRDYPVPDFGIDRHILWT